MDSDPGPGYYQGVGKVVFPYGPRALQLIDPHQEEQKYNTKIQQ